MRHDHLYQYDINRLNDQIAYLEQHINHLYTSLAQKNVYEYHIQRIKIEKVKGTLQFGQLIQHEIKAKEAIHRFYIGEISITEIQETGTVGLGVSEIEKRKKVSLEEATEETKKIYDEIKQLLDIDTVPDFFQRLAVKKDLLQKVWEVVGQSMDSSQAFHLFYEEVLKRLYEITIPEMASSPKVSNDICKSLADCIEAQAKTLLIIILILETLLPGYLVKFRQEPETISPLINNAVKPYEKESSKHILRLIKAGFHLEELPSSFKKLEDFPEALKFMFYATLQPVVENGQADQLLQHMKDLFILKAERVSTGSLLIKISPKAQSYLFSQLITHLKSYPKFILLEYLALPICGDDDIY